MAALMLSAMIAAWLGLFGPLDLLSIDLSKIQPWQPLIAASIAAAGVAFTAYIAVRNVSKQVRINILGREEDRFVRELPGLRDALAFCEAFDFIDESYFPNATSFFLERGIGLPDSHIDRDVATALPITDAATRLRLERLTQNLWSCAINAEARLEHIRRLESEISMLDASATEASKQLEEKIADHRVTLDDFRGRFWDSKKEFEAEVAAIKQKIEIYEPRLVRIRREIEVYFGY
jgi:hypothetical protein